MEFTPNKSEQLLQGMKLEGEKQDKEGNHNRVANKPRKTLENPGTKIAPEKKPWKTLQM